MRADIVLRVDTELHGIKYHDQIVDNNKGREKKLKNKGGKTAVSILILVR